MKSNALMIEYKPVSHLVNGEIIEDLLNLCNGSFVNPYVQPYPGANRECQFCGCIWKMGTVEVKSVHAWGYPGIKYLELVKKHKRFIVKK